LDERIRRRKMRSDAGSIEKFKVVRGQVVECNLINQKMDDFFDPWDLKLKTKQLDINANRENKRPNWIIYYYNHLSRCFILRRWRYYFMSDSSGFLGGGSVEWCWINFLSYFILISLSFNYFYFSLIMSSFFYSSSFFELS